MVGGRPLAMRLGPIWEGICRWLESWCRRVRAWHRRWDSRIIAGRGVVGAIVARSLGRLGRGWCGSALWWFRSSGRWLCSVWVKGGWWSDGGRFERRRRRLRLLRSWKRGWACRWWATWWVICLFETYNIKGRVKNILFLMISDINGVLWKGDSAIFTCDQYDCKFYLFILLTYHKLIENDHQILPPCHNPPPLPTIPALLPAHPPLKEFRRHVPQLTLAKAHPEHKAR